MTKQLENTLKGVPALIVQNLVKALSKKCSNCQEKGLAPCTIDEYQCTYSSQLISITQQIESDN